MDDPDMTARAAAEKLVLEAAPKDGLRLANWPPSRGPNPNEGVQTFTPGKMELVEAPDPKLYPDKSYARRANYDTPGGGYSIEIMPTLTLEQADAFLIAKWQEAKPLQHKKMKVGKSYTMKELRGPGWDPLHAWEEGEVPASILAILDYPLRKRVGVRIEPMSRVLARPKEPGKARIKYSFSPGYFLWQVSKAYQEIYARHEEFGVWGHGLGDLVFEGVVVAEAKDGEEGDGVGRVHGVVMVGS